MKLTKSVILDRYCGYSDITKQKYCEEDMNNNKIEDWQKNALISSSIIFGLCVIGYIVIKE